VKAAEELRELGARTVLASLGADGQLLVDDAGTWSGSARVTAVRSDVGAGDSSLAGFLTSGGTGPEALASAVAHGGGRPAARQRDAVPGRPRPGGGDGHDGRTGGPPPETAGGMTPRPAVPALSPTS
jgi:sugar/nucleoside kinase (ribokinase family)